MFTIRKSFDYRNNLVCCDGEGVVIYGKIDKKKHKIKFHFGETMFAQLGPVIVYGLFFVLQMCALALLGLLASLIMTLAGVDASTLTNWFFDIFRFGKGANMIVSSIFPVLLYIKGLIVAIIAFCQAKKEF